jgi:hypothetical protein
MRCIVVWMFHVLENLHDKTLSSILAIIAVGASSTLSAREFVKYLQYE